ncbi:MAG: LPXTG cell wall anchor domain-containing protein [Carnobacterium sp.]|uniref:LPXTG cell wall anchor domain-containing protein n=1 Tax=Carnobacterium sp. TaxID=48221 RepID=UPI002FCAD66E
MNKIKIVVLSFCCLGVIFVGHPESKVYADDADYKSNSGVGFYGEYIFPSDPPEVQPPVIEPETPEPSKPGAILPQTGEVKTAAFNRLGLVLLLSVWGLLQLKQKNKDKLKEI